MKTPSVKLAPSQAPYLLSREVLLRELRTSGRDGLSHKEALKRAKLIGKNEIPTQKRWRVALLFLERFKDVLVLILLAAAVVSVVLGHGEDAIIIMVAIAIDVALSFIQVWRTEKTLNSMRKRIADTISVIREGRIVSIPSAELVVGDIIELRSGETVPADGRVLEAKGLTLQEAVLTGESADVEKQTSPLSTKTPATSQTNMVFAGTSVVNGTGRAVVVRVGTQTEFGKIALMLREQKSPPSPLRRKLQQSGVTIGWIIIGSVLVLMGLDFWRGNSLEDTARTAITLVVSAIPEDLTMILTIALTVGVARILRKGGVVRKLGSGETLGAATVICTDKTGTLTEGNMKAVELTFLQGSTLLPRTETNEQYEQLALQGLALANDAQRVRQEGGQEGEWEYLGSATERAALAFAEAGGILKSEVIKRWKVRDELSFNSEWKYRASLVDHPTRPTQVLFVTGAPDVLIERSSQCLAQDNRPVNITADRRRALLVQIDTLANQGKRLLAVATRQHLEQEELVHDDVHELLFLGVLVIEDPIRSDVAGAIELTRQAGVMIKLVTGDHAGTAKAVARSIGLTAGEAVAIDGERMREMSDAELRNQLPQLQIFSRVEPLDKQRIVRLLREDGEVVAMTGDGVNDAVALKSADIGVAMGSGTDIAKDASDLVLLNNSFATIVAAIKEGRVLRENVRKVIAFLLSTNAAEVAIFFVSIIAGLPLPLLPAQILWINLVTDGTSDIALSLEPAEKGVMQRPPEDPDVSLISRSLVWRILFRGALLTIGTMSLFWYVLQMEGDTLAYARTMAFTFLAVSSLLSVWSFRSLTHLIWEEPIFNNPWVAVSSSFSLGLQMTALYVPGLRSFFGTVPLGLYDWIMILVLAIATVLAIDLGKLLWRRHDRLELERLKAVTAT